MNADWSLRIVAAELAKVWHTFFHAPCDTRVCAAIRIAYAAIVLVHLAVLYPDLEMLFTDRGVLPLAAAREIGSAHASSIFWQLPSTLPVMKTCLAIMAGHAVLLLIGFLPRLNAAALFVWIASLQARNGVINDGEDTAMRMLGFFLIFMPIGQCWSVNALIARWRGQKLSHLAPGWSLRLFQIQMATVFLSTALVKLQGDAWVDGTALYYVSRLDDFFGKFWVPTFAFDTPWVVALLTWAVVLVELLVPLLIWFRETRVACLLALLVFHLANEWTMHLFLFHWIMLCGWLSFLTPDDFSRAKRTLSRFLAALRGTGSMAAFSSNLSERT